jgi:hypothetical protein
MSTAESSTVERFKTVCHERPARALVVAAAVLHLTLATAVFVVGRAQLAPSQFDADGMGRFAPDSEFYLPQVEALADVLGHEGPAAWARRPSLLHIRLYSLPVAALGFGCNVLTVEPLNLLYYLALLILVFEVAENLFDRRAALFAAAVTGLWPSLLLHTTQLLKDPLLMVALLVLVLSLCRLQTAGFSLPGGAASGVVASVAAAVVWIVRTSMWDVVRLTVLLGIGLAVVAQVRGRRARPGNIVAACLLIAAVLVLPVFRETLNSQRTLTGGRPLNVQIEDVSIEERIGMRRAWSNGADGDVSSGSAVDANVQFHNKADMLWYLPRAAEIGLLAPFPDMWFGRGARVNTSGRLLSGFEMLLTYALELLALVGVWHNRRRPGAWFILLVFGVGAVGLGMVVRNVGTLYRLRYPFWVLLVILAAGGAARLLPKARATGPAR